MNYTDVPIWEKYTLTIEEAAFYTAIQDDCIRKNPFDFHINTVLDDNTEPKVPLTPASVNSP